MKRHIEHFYAYLKLASPLSDRAYRFPESSEIPGLFHSCLNHIPMQLEPLGDQFVDAHGGNLTIQVHQVVAYWPSQPG